MATYTSQLAGVNPATGTAGGAFIEVIEAKDSGGDFIPAAQFANNGSSYWGLATSSTVVFLVTAQSAAQIQLGLAYSMSSSSASDVSVDLEIAGLKVGNSPTESYGSGLNAMLTPGANTNQQFEAPSSWSLSPSQQGDVFRCRLTRQSDSHAGDLRILSITAV